jgi:hypothetical protein
MSSLRDNPYLRDFFEQLDGRVPIQKFADPEAILTADHQAETVADASEELLELVEAVRVEQDTIDTSALSDEIAFLFDVASMIAREYSGNVPLRLRGVSADIAEFSLIFSYTSPNGLPVDVRLTRDDAEACLPAFTVIWDALARAQ